LQSYDGLLSMLSSAAGQATAACDAGDDFFTQGREEAKDGSGTEGGVGGVLAELHLAAMRRECEAVARQAQQESWSYLDFLGELVEREVQQRRHNRIARLLKASRLPLEKSWPSLDPKRLPVKVVQQLRGLLSGDFLDRRENVLVFGTVGSGKTHSLCAVAQELVRQGRRILFTTAQSVAAHTNE
jgi:DNA replication protein DnaC